MNAGPGGLANERTLISVLRRRAAETPDRISCTFLGESPLASRSLSYRDLDRQARSLAALLQIRGHAGKPALLLYPAGIDFLVAFYACMYAGSPAIPAPAPDAANLKRTAPRLRAIVEDARASIVLCTSAVMQLLVGAFPGNLAEWQPTDGYPANNADDWRDPETGEESLAVLQYTSGSTRIPEA